MARFLRAFTLDKSTIEQVDGILHEGLEGSRIKLLLPNIENPAHESELAPKDEYDLTKADYTELRALIGAEAVKPTGWSAKFPRSDWQVLMTMLTTDCTSDEKRTLIELAIKDAQKRNRREWKRHGTRQVRSTKRSLHVNASRVADALILLGLETLNGRITANCELAGSTESNASQGQVKRIRSAGRRTTKV